MFPSLVSFVVKHPQACEWKSVVQVTKESADTLSLADDIYIEEVG